MGYLIIKISSPISSDEIFISLIDVSYYLLNANATFTAQATVQPTIGLLPIPRKPIISTCAGTEEEPAN